MSSKYRNKYGLYRHTDDAANSILDGRLGIYRKEGMGKKSKEKKLKTHMIEVDVYGLDWQSPSRARRCHS